MKVSLVVPVKNEADSIETLLASLGRQERCPDEVILVDGGSRDGTAEQIEDWARRNARPGWIRVLRAGEATPGKGRNLGAEAAAHEWIAFTDAGMRLEDAWLRELVETAERDPRIEVVYGGFEPVTETFFEQCAALAYVAPKQLRDGQWMRGPVVPSSLLRKAVWAAAGGFPDLRAAEDLMFMEAIARGGHRVAWASRAIVHWRLQPTLAKTFQRFALYSEHNVRIGRQADWHFGIARQYAVWIACALLAVFATAWAWAALALGYGLRVAKTLWLRREGRGPGWLLHPARFLGVTSVLLTIDLATFVGWARAIYRSSRAGRDVRAPT
jgi:glycosyltransferase involved in cell wall biosynthesis